ncbi:MAG: hypothetical protein ACJA2W_001232 [Planctomycetota bacterium]|jgi:hypothetical protein
MDDNVGRGASNAPGRGRRRLRQLIALAVLVGAFVAWWHFPSATTLSLESNAAEVFESASSWELISTAATHKDIPNPGPDDPMPPELFHWREILGRVTVEDAGTRRMLTRAFNRGRRGPHNAHMLCFNPRHAIRAALPGGEQMDLLICFECLNYRVYDGDGVTIEIGSIHDSPAATFNRVYRGLGLEIAPDTRSPGSSGN